MYFLSASNLGALAVCRKDIKIDEGRIKYRVS
jgi:hypothetical protein